MDPLNVVVVKHADVSATELMRHLANTQPEFYGAAAIAASSAASALERLQYSGNAGRAANPWNQPFCEHLKIKADKYRSDSRREKLGQTLERARRSILNVTAELRSRQDFLAVKGVGPYVCRELEDVLNQITGQKQTAEAAKPKKKKSSSGDTQAVDGEHKPAVNRRTSKNAAKAGVSPPTMDEAAATAVIAAGIPRSASLQPPKPVRTVEMTSLKRSVSLNASSTMVTSTETICLLDSPERVAPSKIKPAPEPIPHLPPISAGTVIRANSLSTTNGATSSASTQLSRAASLARTNSITSQNGTSKRARVETESLHCESQDGAELILLLDSREIGSTKERHFFENRLRELGINVEVRGLPLGDVTWIFRTRSGREFVCDTIIERKTADDLALSIKDGRFKEQKSRLSESGMDRMIYLVEGNIYRTGENIPIKAMETAIRQTRLSGFIVFETANRDATCEFLCRIHHTVLKKFHERKYRADELSNWLGFQERARVQQCETVGEVFQAMLVQVPGCSSDKARAITELYPTPLALARAYLDPSLKLPDRDAEWKRREKLLQDIPCGVAKRRLGPKLSATIARLYCVLDYESLVGQEDEEDSEEEGDSQAS